MASYGSPSSPASSSRRAFNIYPSPPSSSSSSQPSASTSRPTGKAQGKKKEGKVKDPLRPLLLPQLLQKPRKAFSPPTPWSPSSRPPSPPPDSAGYHRSYYQPQHGQQPYQTQYQGYGYTAPAPAPEEFYASTPPLTSTDSDYPFSPSSSRSSSPPSTPHSGRSTPTSSSFCSPGSPPNLAHAFTKAAKEKRDSQRSLRSDRSDRSEKSERSEEEFSGARHVAFSQRVQVGNRARARPTGEYITPPEQSLLRPTTFWKNAYRTALGHPSDAPSSSLVRSASFIAAGQDLPAPEEVREDLVYLCFTPRKRDWQETERVVLPPESFGVRAY